MRHLLKKLLPSVAVALTVTGLSLPMPARAQTYPIDCAILLCLSGGWPASVPCARARAEFIRRITPWPVEPPLQIWRCPMGASYNPVTPSNDLGRYYDILFSDQDRLQPQLTLAVEPLYTETTALRPLTARSPMLPDGFALQFVQDHADIDISGPEFNFVRSIRVFDVRFASQNKSDDDDCSRLAIVRLGTYGTQGDFAWRRSSPVALPLAHSGLERWGERCPSIWHRSVFVDWRDYEGNYGFEQVNY